MYKRRDWLLLHGPDGGDTSESDSDSEFDQEGSDSESGSEGGSGDVSGETPVVYCKRVCSLRASEGQEWGRGRDHTAIRCHRDPYIPLIIHRAGHQH